MGSHLYTQEQFEEKAKRVHGDRYNYSHTVYSDSKTKITILCKDHGLFQQLPSSHLQGSGCPSCKIVKTSYTQDQFEAKARAVHGDRYDYSQAVYMNISTKLTILCRDHGPFDQTPSCHLQGCGCPTCKRLKKAFTQDQFESRARQVHGDLYDYSEAIYLNSTTKLTIICSKHGRFQRSPLNHLNGSGCPLCTVHKLTLSKEQFLAKAQKVHGDRYDYPSLQYKNLSNKIKILCKKHGIFEQKASNHLCGSGCPYCNKFKPLSTQQQFEKKARAVHGNRYDYSEAIYINSTTKLTIICSTHGRFTKTPASHLQGSGCKLCTTKKPLFGIENFKAKAKEIHNNKYDYSESVYLNFSTKLTIICKDHGRFEQTPANHLHGSGCPICHTSKLTLTQEQFEIKARIIHGDHYDYSESVYINYRTKLTIICKDHGRFEQTPSTHLTGSGCPTCNKFKPSLTQQQFEAKARLIHGDRYDYSQSIYLNYITKINIYCKEHGFFEKTPASHLQGSICPSCKIIKHKNNS